MVTAIGTSRYVAAESPWSQSNWLQNQRFDPLWHNLLLNQYMNDLMQRLMCGLEWYRALIDDAINQRRRRLYACIRATRGYFWITTVTQISQNVWNKFKFIVKPIFFSEYRPFLDIWVLQCVWDVMSMITSLHVYCWVHWWIFFFENRSIFGKVMSKSGDHVFDLRGI